MSKIKSTKRIIKTRGKSPSRRRSQNAVNVKIEPDDIEFTYREEISEDYDETYYKPKSVDEYLRSISVQPKVEVKSENESNGNGIKLMGAKVPKCNICMKTFGSITNLNRHKLIHSTKNGHECKVCRKKHHSGASLKYHHRLMHEEKALKCTFCDMRFGQKYSLCVHIRTKHFNLLRQQDKSTGTLHELFLGTKSFECYRCKYSTSTRSILLRHMRNIHSKVNSKCDFNEDVKFRCSLCKQYLENRKNLQKHLLLHSDDRPYKCNYCSKNFTKRYEKSEHQYQSHSELLSQKPNNTKQFECELCHANYRRKDYLKRHQQAKHGRENPFKCSICSKKFRDNYLLSAHVRTAHFVVLRQQDKSTGTLHELFQGLRTFECYRCKYSSYIGNVKKHMEICKGKKMLPIKCALCDKGLANQYTHFHHMRKFHPMEFHATEKGAKKKNLTGNEKSQNWSKIQCLECKIYFKSYFKYHHHMLNKHKLNLNREIKEQLECLQNTGESE